MESGDRQKDDTEVEYSLFQYRKKWHSSRHICLNTVQILQQAVDPYHSFGESAEPMIIVITSLYDGL
jgi:hypothetical protein